MSKEKSSNIKEKALGYLALLMFVAGFLRMVYLESDNKTIVFALGILLAVFGVEKVTRLLSK